MAKQPVMDRLPHEKSDIWKKELKALMSDFCIPVNIIEQIIRTSGRKAKRNFKGVILRSVRITPERHNNEQIFWLLSNQYTKAKHRPTGQKYSCCISAG